MLLPIQKGTVSTSKSNRKSFKSLIDFLAWVFYGYGIRLELPVLWSIIFVASFGLIWRVIGLKKSYIILKDKHSKRTTFSLIRFEDLNERSHKWINNFNIVDEFNMLKDALVFSATVFLSGTKLFIDPPEVPETSGRPNPWARRMFILERVLGALFSVLFFLAVSRAILDG